MKIGMVGAGKLGLPVALAIESKGHEVKVYDVNPKVEDYLKDRSIPFRERGLQPLLDKTNITAVDDVYGLVADRDIIFCAIQTPHDPKFEGTTLLTDERKDFDYSYLKIAVSNIAVAAKDQKKRVTLAVISTCLPGTFRREIEPILNEYVEYVYTPQFIAMGTVLDDYLYPEFNLIGVHNPEAAIRLQEFYQTINMAPNVVTDITTAEGIKVSYNTWITAKTVIANAWGEMSHRLGMNFDDLFYAWSLSTKRLISPRYMKAGMSDGGGCHPRDNIALSHIAQQTGMSYDIWEVLMTARERYETWHAGMAAKTALDTGLPLVLMGKAFKPETNIQTGSPALLVAEVLKESGNTFRHIGEDEEFDVTEPSVFFLGVAHEAYKELPYPKGSVVIDPFRMMPKQADITVIGVGGVW